MRKDKIGKEMAFPKQVTGSLTASYHPNSDKDIF